MPNTKNERTPAYRHHKPSGQAVVTLSGRDSYLGPYGTAASRQAYDRLLAEWLVAGRTTQESARADTGITITELTVMYWRHAQAYYVKDGRPTSELPCIRQAVRPLKELYGRTPACAFGPLALKAVRQKMIERNLCRGVVNRHVLRLKQLFKWATQNELIPPSVFNALQTVTGLRQGRTEVRDNAPVRPAPDAHVDAIQNHVNRQVWAVIELQRLIGMRPGEVLSMRGSDLETTGVLWLYTPPSHKTEHCGHSRTVELGPRAQEIVRPFLKHDLQAYLFSPAEAVAEKNLEKRRLRKSKVQPSQRSRSKSNPKRKAHDRYTTASYLRAIKRACDKAWPMPYAIANDATKIADWRQSHRWHPHQLRHNYATRIRKEFGVEAARILLGHRSTAVTELYAEIDRGRVRDIVAKVG